MNFETAIVIPVYNAYDDLVECLESIYKYTNLDEIMLILINDNSSDSRIKSYLDEQRKKRGIHVIHNINNEGFSANINKGFDEAGGADVIILNSDTVVTKGWIQKIKKCAYSRKEIGTVTPLSNNATLCSVPEVFEMNEIQGSQTIDDVSELIEKFSIRKYPEIPVGHGFCMYIKREVIDIVGQFDAETFKKGYGEENDFCNRVIQLGYTNVMCDDTYIYHKGTKSFLSQEKTRLIKEHEQILRERYKKEMCFLDRYCAQNPNYYTGKFMGVFLNLSNKKKNILFVLHDDYNVFGNKSIG